MAYSQTVAGFAYAFDHLVEVLATASPRRSGDELTGCAVETDAERAAAQWVLADVELSELLENPVVAYEDDEVTRLIVDSHDREVVAPISHLTVGGPRDHLLEVTADPTRAEADADDMDALPTRDRLALRSPHGLGYARAAEILLGLVQGARELGESGVRLKDRSSAPPPELT